MFLITKGSGKDRFESVTSSAIEAENLRARGYNVEKVSAEKKHEPKPESKK